MFRGPCPPSLTRLAFIAMLTLCLLAKPMFALAADLHHDLHAVAHTLVHGNAADHAERDVPAGPDDAEHDPVTGWHVLMHLDFCCGVIAVATHDAPALIHRALPAIVPDGMQGFVQIGPIRHFRPPIAA